MNNVAAEESGFTRLASFVCDCEPFTEEELEGIEASLSNPNIKRRRFNHLTPRRRRLPASLIALQHPNLSSLPPLPGSLHQFLISAFYYAYFPPSSVTPVQSFPFQSLILKTTHLL